MIDVNDGQILVRTLAVRECSSASGSTRYEVRVGLEHEPDDTSGLVECSAAVEAILEEQMERADIDEKSSRDVISIALKRDFPRCRYHLGIYPSRDEDPDRVVDAAKPAKQAAVEATTQVEFVGSVVLQPTITAVHGSLRVRWTVEAQLTGSQLLALSSMVKNAYVAGSVYAEQATLKLATG